MFLAVTLKISDGTVLQFVQTISTKERTHQPVARVHFILLIQHSEQLYNMNIKQ